MRPDAKTLGVGLVLLAAGACVDASQSGADSSGAGVVTTGASASGEGSGGADDADASGGSSAAVPMDCGEVEYVVAAQPPNVVLVLDKSASMVSTADVDADGVQDGFWDHDDDAATPGISRWHSLHSVVEFVVTGFENQISFGAVLFPSTAATNDYSASACAVRPDPEVGVAPSNAEAILAAIPEALQTDLEGATPASAGIRTAVEHLRSLDPEVPRYMILVTDGAANCSADLEAPELLEDYDENLPVFVADALAQDAIPTFVVGIDIEDVVAGGGADGIPEANTFVELNAVALAGGRARGGMEKFFNTTTEAELQAALEGIAGEVLSCVVPLQPLPEHPDFVDVDLAGTSVPRVSDCASEDGWVFVHPAGPFDAIELCGSACGLLAEVGQADVTFGCPPEG